MDKNETYSIHNLGSKLFGFFSIKVIIYRFILPRKFEADFHSLHKLFWGVTRENIHKKIKLIIILIIIIIIIIIITITIIITIPQCIRNQCNTNNSTSNRALKLVDTLILEFYNVVD